jgi:hypothetical protein
MHMQRHAADGCARIGVALLSPAGAVLLVRASGALSELVSGDNVWSGAWFLMSKETFRVGSVRGWIAAGERKPRLRGWCWLVPREVRIGSLPCSGQAFAVASRAA